MTSPAPFKIFKAAPPAPPIGRKPTGFRGNHWHKKVLYDPVYPTTKVPTALIPRYPTDWRNGGRALLMAALAKLEGHEKVQESLSLKAHREACQTPQTPLTLFQRPCAGRRRSAGGIVSRALLTRHRHVLDFQHQGGFCSSRCLGSCAKELKRCLCAWRCSGFHAHVVQMDGMLASFKGEVKTDKPLFSVLRRQARKNKWAQQKELAFSSTHSHVHDLAHGSMCVRTPSKGMVYDPTTGHFSPLVPASHPAFEAFDRDGPEPNTKPPPRLDPPLPFYSASHVPDVPHPPPPKPYTGPLEAVEDSDDEDELRSSTSSLVFAREAEVRWRDPKSGDRRLVDEDSDGEEIIRGASVSPPSAEGHVLWGV
ncbi:hypothetical protein CSUI_007458 [Cystoisospora suis]|uniref:Uncharacterized protein n=1 Tax=Cystoisospora suis TaxID=483139 RepID=A0A2C6KQD3_9APIC|nr:hypothetical protein CSUI_007458 [Cystoisospora suis]